MSHIILFTSCSSQYHVFYITEQKWKFNEVEWLVSVANQL